MVVLVSVPYASSNSLVADRDRDHGKTLGGKVGEGFVKMGSGVVVGGFDDVENHDDKDKDKDKKKDDDDKKDDDKKDDKKDDDKKDDDKKDDKDNKNKSGDYHRKHTNERNHCLDRVWTEPDACEFIRSPHCADVGVGVWFSYAKMWVCSKWRNWFTGLFWLAALGVYLFNLFSIAGVVSADLLAPNVRTLLSRISIPTAFTTGILLALGNGSIEIFTAISATRSGQTNLAYGGLVSSAFCATTLVVGMVAFFHPFSFVRRAFLRDTFFFVIVIITSIVILSDDDIKMHEALGFLFMFLIYLALVTFGSTLFGRDHEDEQLDPIDAPLPVLDEDENARHPGSFAVVEPRKRQRWLVFEYLDRFLPAKEETRDGEVRESLLQEPSMASLMEPVSSGVDERPRVKGYGTVTAEDMGSQFGRGGRRSVWSAFAVAERSNRAVYSHLSSGNGTRKATVGEWLFPTLPMVGGGLMSEWTRRTGFERILAVVVAPAIFMVRVCIVVVGNGGEEGDGVASVAGGVVETSSLGRGGDEREVLFSQEEEGLEPKFRGVGSYDEDEEEDLITGSSSTSRASTVRNSPNPRAKQYQQQQQQQQRKRPRRDEVVVPPKPLLCVQVGVSCFLVAMWVLDVLGLAYFSIWATLVAGIVGGLAGYAVWEDRVGVEALRLIGVMGSLGLMAVVSREIVGVLGGVGVALGWGGVLVGVVVLMVGCQFGDILTNLSLAHTGHTSLSVRSTFVTPMLNLLFGIGFASVWVLLVYGGVKRATPIQPPPSFEDDDDDDDFEIAIFTSNSIFFMLFGLLVSVGGLMVLVPLRGFRVERWLGRFLCDGARRRVVTTLNLDIIEFDNDAAAVLLLVVLYRLSA
ncbi:hypothetical protein HDU97_007724 [Phlyctochytrium planicorne]|nr:hypothetical protein HDU97_007724 [Phlyctochytrium planicorne]